MPIVEGRYEASIGTTYKDVDTGIEALRAKIRKSRNIRINNIPMHLLRDLKSLLHGKDLKIILPLGEKSIEEWKDLGDIAVTKARIYHRYDEVEANAGSISFSDIVFNITWLDNKIMEISTMEFSKCVKCMRATFDTAWRYSEKKR
jgi:hypothetical protein